MMTMRVLNADLSRFRPRLLTQDDMKVALCMVTLGAKREYPIPPGLQVEHWQLEETQNLPMEQVHRIRNEVETLVRHFVRNKGWMKSTRRRVREWAPTGL
jgi:hypothetical protein